MPLIKRAFMVHFNLSTVIYVTCNTLDQRTCRGHRKAEIPGQSDWIRLTTRRAIPEMPRGIPEIPRREKRRTIIGASC